MCECARTLTRGATAFSPAIPSRRLCRGIRSYAGWVFTHTHTYTQAEGREAERESGATPPALGTSAVTEFEAGKDGVGEGERVIRTRIGVALPCGPGLRAAWCALRVSPHLAIVAMANSSVLPSLSS